MAQQSIDRFYLTLPCYFSRRRRSRSVLSTTLNNKSNLISTIQFTSLKSSVSELSQKQNGGNLTVIQFRRRICMFRATLS